jgi:chromosome partition protein MukF
VNDQLYTAISNKLSAHQHQHRSIDLGQVLKDYLAEHPHAQHFDIARMVVDQAVRLGFSESDYAAIQPEWQSINNRGAKVQANVINKF